MPKHKKDPLNSSRLSEKAYRISVGKKQRTIRILSMETQENDMALIRSLVGTKNIELIHTEEKTFDDEVEEVLKEMYFKSASKKGKSQHA